MVHDIYEALTPILRSELMGHTVVLLNFLYHFSGLSILGMSNMASASIPDP